MISAWFQFVFQDEACTCTREFFPPLCVTQPLRLDMHCSLAMIASYTDYFVGHARVSPPALCHLTKAYALVNKKLSGTEATSMTTIATVTSLAIYHRIHHLQSVSMIHFKGLQRLILLRGGMAKLGRESPALAQKAWR